MKKYRWMWYLSVARSGEFEEVLKDEFVGLREHSRLAVDDAQVVLQLHTLHQNRPQVRFLAVQLRFEYVIIVTSRDRHTLTCGCVPCCVASSSHFDKPSISSPNHCDRFPNKRAKPSKPTIKSLYSCDVLPTLK